MTIDNVTDILEEYGKVLPEEIVEDNDNNTQSSNYSTSLSNNVVSVCRHIKCQQTTATWIVDSGATKHMTPDQSLFTEYTTWKSVNKEKKKVVVLGDGNFLLEFLVLLLI